MWTSDLVLRPIGWVESPVTDPSVASRQGDEGAPDCWLVFDADVRPALDGLRPGDDIVVLTWLHLRRPNRPASAPPRRHQPADARRVRHPFPASTEPARRPRQVTILAVDDLRLRVHGLEAIDGTPIVDIKPVLEPRGKR